MISHKTIYLKISSPGQTGSKKEANMHQEGSKKEAIQCDLRKPFYNLHKIGLRITQEIDRFENWLKVPEWYSKHYGKRRPGCWVDWFEDQGINFRPRVHEVLKSGNPHAIIGSSSYGISEYTHGHCDDDWNYQQQYHKPYYGRWHPGYEIQWHVFQYLGNSWGKSDTAHSTESIINYATDVIKGGGVFTFDIDQEEMLKGIFLDIPEGQMQQLMAVKKALMNIDRKDSN